MQARAKIVLLLRMLGVGAIAVVLVLAAGEVAIRLLAGEPAQEPAPQSAPAEAAGILSADPDPELAWIFPPRSEGRVWSGEHVTEVRTDHLGLRNPTARSRPGTDTRIIVLGDSYAFGWGVREEEAFPRQLERMIRERYPGALIEVVNAGVPGYGLYQQRALLERILSDAPADIVVSTFSLANDPVDDLRVLRFAPDRLVEYSPDLRGADSLVGRVIARSRLLSLLDYRTGPLQFKLANTRGAALDAASRCVHDLLSTCEARGLPILVVVVPQRSEITYTGLKARLVGAGTASARRLVARIADEHGVSWIDATEALRALHARECAYLANDRHWTPAGHEAVAREILEAIPEEWLLNEPR